MINHNIDFLTIICIAIGVSIDALVASLAYGMAIQKNRLRKAVKVGFFFGFFQMMMPLAGWFLGIKLRVFIQEIDHWVAFVLLGLIGCKMIYESFKEKKVCRVEKFFTLAVLLTVSVATSIDALAVGLSFAALNVAILIPAIAMGVVTFCSSSVGVFMGNKFSDILGRRVEIVGGLILIGIGFKILLEHLIKGV